MPRPWTPMQAMRMVSFGPARRPLCLARLAAAHVGESAARMAAAVARSESARSSRRVMRGMVEILRRLPFGGGVRESSRGDAFVRERATLGHGEWSESGGERVK